MSTYRMLYKWFTRNDAILYITHEHESDSLFSLIHFLHHVVGVLILLYPRVYPLPLAGDEYKKM